MKPLLSQAGFDIKGVADDADLINSAIQDVSAVVISLAVVSPVSMNPPQVLQFLKTRQFAGKIIFAGLVPFERVENNLKQFLAETGWEIEVQALSSPQARDGAAVYIEQRDLAASQAPASRDFLTTWV